MMGRCRRTHGKYVRHWGLMAVLLAIALSLQGVPLAAFAEEAGDNEEVAAEAVEAAEVDSDAAEVEADDFQEDEEAEESEEATEADEDAGVKAAAQEEPADEQGQDDSVTATEANDDASDPAQDRPAAEAEPVPDVEAPGQETSSESANAVNHSLAEAVAWANARAAEGWCVDVDGAAGVQCVDLILAYYDYLVGWHTSGNAIDYASNTLPAGWTRVSSPRAGDVVVWNKGVQIGSSSIGGGNEWANSTYGHIGIVTEVRDGYFVSVETNTYYGGKPATPHNRLASGVACYIRPDFVTNRDPVGAFVSCAGGDNNTLRIQGWAYDPDVPNDAISIHVYVGGSAGSGAACYSTDAVGNALLANHQFRSQGKSEFDYTLRVNEIGSQAIYVYAINNVPYTNNPELSGSGATAIICSGGKGDATTTLAEGRYAIRAKLAPTSGIEVKGASQTQNDPVALHSWGGGAHQQFDLVKNSDSSYLIKAAHTGKAIEIYGANCANGIVPSQHEAHGGVAQRWWLEPTSGGAWLIRHRVSGKYLGLVGTNVADGAKVQQSGKSGGDNQQWYFVPVNASRWEVSVDGGDGTDREPKPTVTAGGVTLAEGTDYDVTYKNNDKPGTATLTVTGKNGFTGSASATYDIVSADLSEAVVELEYLNTAYTGKAQRPAVTVTLDGQELVAGTDYEVAYANNTAAGLATVTVTGKEPYEGSATATFKIVSTSKNSWVDLLPEGKGYVKGGALVKGWLTLGNAKHYFGDDYAMLTGWQDVVVDGKTMHYYFNPASGNLARGTWMTIDGAKYYFRPSGNMATGWATITDDNGVDKKYYFDESGQMVTGWQDIVNDEGKTNHYYFRPSGSMATGWAEIDGEYVYFRPSGNMATGFTSVADDAYKRYFDEQGHMLTGWQEIGDNTYYFRASGAMQTGTATIDGMAFTFNDKGVLVG